jgi:hypothetical protein
VFEGSRSRIALFGLASLTTIAYVAVATHGRIVEGDSTILVSGARGVASCLANGEFRGCSRPTSAFPVLQYLLALPAIALGATDQSILRMFSLVSTLSVPLCVGAGWWAGRAMKERRWATVIAIVLAVGPLIAYGPSTFREALASLTLVVALGTVLHNCRATVVALTIALACLHQDTAFVFLVPLALLAARTDGRLLPTWGRTRPILVGAGAAVLITVAANQLRFATFTSPFTGQEWRTPTSWIPEMYISLLASPNGGLIPFWPAASLMLIALAGVTLHRVRTRPSEPLAWAPPLVLLLIVAAHVLLLAMWWSPFGWFGWGPRLSVPFTAAFCVTTAAVLDRGATSLFDRIHQRRAITLIAGLLLSISALPHLVFLFADNHARYIQTFFLEGDEACPAAIGSQVGDPATVAYYYDCVIWHRAWHREPYVLIDTMVNSDWTAGRLAFMASYSATIVLALVVGLRRDEDATQRAIAGSAVSAWSEPQPS